MLTACSAPRLAYNNGPFLTWWWLDAYVDFSREQTPLAKAAIDRYFDWHRRTQLMPFAPLLASARQLVMEPITAAAACRINTQVREKLEPAIERAAIDAAELVPGLGEAQFKHMEQRYAKANTEMRRDYMQPDLTERQRKAFERTLERAEQLYGRLDDAQKQVIAAGVAASPFDPQAWLVERQRRQRDVLQALRKLKSDGADSAARIAVLRQLGERMEQSPDPAYRAYQQKLEDYNCAFAAQVHNATTAAQRQAARERIVGWEEDLRSLSSQPAT